MLYILIYIYANVLNYILFQSILTNILCMFNVPNTNIIIHACISILILYSLPCFICCMAVILNTLYAFYGFMSRCFTLVFRKIAQIS